MVRILATFKQGRRYIVEYVPQLKFLPSRTLRRLIHGLSRVVKAVQIPVPFALGHLYFSVLSRPKVRIVLRFVITGAAIKDPIIGYKWDRAQPREGFLSFFHDVRYAVVLLSLLVLGS